MKLFLAVASVACLTGSILTITSSSATAAAKAAQAAMDVNVVNTPIVKIGNIPKVRVYETVVVRELNYKEPYHHREGSTFQVNETKMPTFDNYTVPLRKQLVIENVSYRSDMAMESIAMRLDYHDGDGPKIVTYLPIVPMVNGWRTGHTEVSMRIPSGVTVSFISTRTGTSGAYLTLFYSGYLEPAP
ncbi:MAG TPA: hypothetical protein VGE01_12395 [Fimbriimonas sp.]